MNKGCPQDVEHTPIIVKTRKLGPFDYEWHERKVGQLEKMGYVRGQTREDECGGNRILSKRINIITEMKWKTK